MTDFDQAPFIVIWETTRACDLACVHCRATAQPLPLPGELTREEGLALIDQVAAMGAPVLVLSGGDPLTRGDLTDLIRRGKSRGLRVGTIPAATPRLSHEAVLALEEAGLDQMALSLDASTAEAHDRFRGVAGAFDKTMQAAAWAHEAGLPLQINTVMSASNFWEVDRLIALVQQLDIVFWEVFFLVPVGRGARLAGLTPGQYEEVFARLYEASRAVSFTIKVTEAPQYRRHIIQQYLKRGGRAAQPGAAPASRPRREDGGLCGSIPLPVAAANGGHLGHAAEDAVSRHAPGGGAIGLAPRGVNAGKGHCFVSCTGEVYPSGFLPLSAGNIRQVPLAELYRSAPLFQQLRRPELLKGRCGRCDYRDLCGGSRSRAYAVTGDYLAEEPCCEYRPQRPS